MTLFNEDDLMLILLTPTKVHLPSSALQTSGPSMKHTILSSTAAVRPMYQIGGMHRQTRRRDANILVNQVAVGTSTITKAKSSTAFRVLAASKVES